MGDGMTIDPKSEIRNPKEGRNLKAEIRTWSDFGFRISFLP
jgi:hypothetical protein